MARSRKKRPKKNGGPHIYWRSGRAYADFRAYADVGGDRGALSLPGSSWGVTDLDVAQALFDAQLAEFVAKRQKQAGVPQTRRKETTLAALVRDHLLLKAKAGQTSHAHLVDLEIRLGAAVEYFGAHRNPRDVSSDDVREWMRELSDGWRGRKRKDGTVRHYINALSGLYKRANEQLVVDAGYNPVAALVEKPSGWSGRPEAPSFEVHEAALLLEAARVVEKRNRLNATPALYAIVATFLLTGGRKSEVLGLDVEDVSFDRGLVYFHPNAHRGLKTKTSRRDVPLWPQLRQILQEWLYGGEQPRTTGLLFPATAGTGGGMVGNLSKSLDEIGKLCGMRPNEVRTKAFRHSYCSTRLQTVTTVLKPGHKATDADAWTYEPVSHDAVAREMGHGGTEMVRRIYGHRARDPHRANEVAYRVDEHREKLTERLTAVLAAS